MTDAPDLHYIKNHHIDMMHYPFFGSFAQQRPESFVAINDLLNSHDFSAIIEIGTHDCGLSIFFALYSWLSFHKQDSDHKDRTEYKNLTHHKRPRLFITYDIEVRDKSALSLLTHLGGVFINQDVFNDIENIKNFVNQGGKTLILCDGGDKIKEFNTFSEILKSGDIIMAHDYMGSDEFKNSNYNINWNSCEIQYNDIKDCLNKNNMQLIHEDVFNPVFWCCATKL